jgi:hypothetical protein
MDIAVAIAPHVLLVLGGVEQGDVSRLIELVDDVC